MFIRFLLKTIIIPVILTFSYKNIDLFKIICRSDYSHVTNFLDLLNCAPGLYFSQEVVLKSRVNLLAVPVMVCARDPKIGRIVKIRIPRI